MSNKNLIGLNLEIDENVIARSVNTAIEAAIIAALGDKEQLVQSVVSHVLNQKVNSEGKMSSYSSDNKFTLIDVIVRKAIHKTAVELVEEIVEENRTEFKRILKKQISQSKTLDDFVKSFIDGAVSAAQDKYRARLEFIYRKDD